MSIKTIFQNWKLKKAKEKEENEILNSERRKVELQAKQEAITESKDMLKEHYKKMEMEKMSKPKKNFLNTIADEFKTMGDKAGKNLSGEFERKETGGVSNDKIATLMGRSSGTENDKISNMLGNTKGASDDKISKMLGKDSTSTGVSNDKIGSMFGRSRTKREANAKLKEMLK
jgi:hypothetical protein